MKQPMIAVMAMLLVAACGRQETNSDGNGPGNADGAGGRQDPPAAPAIDSSAPVTDSASQPPSSDPSSDQGTDSSTPATPPPP